MVPVDFPFGTICSPNQAYHRFNWDAEMEFDEIGSNKKKSFQEIGDLFQLTCIFADETETAKNCEKFCKHVATFCHVAEL